MFRCSLRVLSSKKDHENINKGNKVIGGPSLIIPAKSIETKEILTDEKVFVSILDRHVRKLKIKEIASV